jgi:hypothetical protein
VAREFLTHSGKRRWIALGIAATVAMGIVLANVWDRSSSHEGAHPTRSQDPQPSGAGRSPSEAGLVQVAERAAASTSGAPSEDDPEPRIAVDNGVLSGLVVDNDGTPLIGAEVSWTALDASAWDPHVPPGPSDRATIRTATRWAATDERGRFVFDDDPRAEESAASVLWITCPGFIGRSSLHEGRIVGEPRIALPARESRDVIVVNATGEAVPGVDIEHFGSYPIDNEFGDPLRVAGGYAFHRRARSGSDGSPDPPLVHVDVGETMIGALDDVAGAPWRETRENKELPIRLVIGPTFLASGRVLGELPLGSLTGAEVEVVGVVGQSSEAFASTPVRPDGGWGPIAAALVDGAVYGLRLRGGQLAEDELHIPTPEAGDHVRLDFQAALGIGLGVRVEDAGGQPISGALVTVQVGGAGGTVTTRYGSTTSSGLAQLRGIRLGMVRLTVQAAGFTTQDVDWVEILSDREQPLVVALTRSRPIAGRVILDGEAVEDFTVVWWTRSMLATGRQQALPFSGREEGRFELDGIPGDETVWLMGSAPGLARSLTIRCEAGGQEREFVLELRNPASARGQIVDAVSGAPIPGAEVQLWMNEGHHWVHASSAPQRVDGQGRFELSGIAPGSNRFVVAASGYSDYLGTVFGQDGLDIDLGAFALLHNQPVTIALAWEGELDPTSYSASLRGTTYEGPIPFGADGTATFHATGPGWTRLIVHDPNGGMRRRILLLLPGEDWTFEVLVSSGATLELQVVRPASGALPSGLTAVIHPARGFDSRRPELESVMTLPLDGSGRGIVRGIPAGPFSVILFAQDGLALGSARGSMGFGDQHLEIPLGTSPLVVQVVDRSGRSLSDSEVFLWGENGGTVSWNDSALTGVDGLATFACVPYRSVSVGARHPEHGMTFGEVVDLSTAQQPHRLQLDVREAVHAILLENGKPSVGTHVTLTATTGYLIGDLASDAEGRVHWPDLAGSGFDLRVTQPGFWPRRVRIGPATRAEPQRVSVHRSGSAKLHLRSPNGAALAGRAIELEHVGLAESPDTWVLSGLLDASALPLVSDAQGTIALPDLPQGLYRWRSQSSDGLLHAGEFELAAGTTIELVAGG